MAVVVNIHTVCLDLVKDIPNSEIGCHVTLSKYPNELVLEFFEDKNNVQKIGEIKLFDIIGASLKFRVKSKGDVHEGKFVYFEPSSIFKGVYGLIKTYIMND